MNKMIVEEIREQYPIGTRIELVSMDDVQAPPIGTRGTIIGVDDIGSIMVGWDNGSSLNVIYGVDKFSVLVPVTTICCGKKRKWESSLDAFHYFTNRYMKSDGAKKKSYAKILRQLRSEADVCSDE